MHEVADQKRSNANELMNQSQRRLQAEFAAWQRRSEELDEQPATPSTARQRRLLDLEYRQLEERQTRLLECRSYVA